MENRLIEIQRICDEWKKCNISNANAIANVAEILEREMMLVHNLIVANVHSGSIIFMADNRDGVKISFDERK